MRILFVCTGNICRSPTAEAVFRHMVDAAGIGGIDIDSAGTHGYHVGEGPDLRAAEAAGLRGYRMDGQRARKIVKGDFEHYDLILAMDEGHYSQLRAIAPARHKNKVRLFLEFAPGTGRRGVPDPYYGEQEGFELVLDLIEAGARGLVGQIAKRDGE